jgi:hypothetical protein
VSTVQTLYNDLAYYIGDEADVLSLFNISVRMIAKRLYWHKSDIITGVLSVPIHNAVTLTASDIAFVNSNPDTITGVAAAFITTGFHVGMPITTTNTSNLGPFHVETVTAGTLTLNADDSLTTVTAGASYIITSDDGYGFLPSDFWGLVDLPYLDGQTSPLLPLPSQNVALQYSSAGFPYYYKIKRNNIHIIPHTSAAYTIKGDYFQKPTILTAMTNTLPFNELFDETIWELIIRLFKGGNVATDALEGHCNRQVDLIVTKREKKAPSRPRIGLNYGNFL